MDKHLHQYQKGALSNSIFSKKYWFRIKGKFNDKFVVLVPGVFNKDAAMF